ncbi:armadillo-type protein [Schizophyllum amplum]|uniref:Armadillo-type protein n=1 Tax=Schizophyllum amplum TaxID=97359 RepID=A0A550C6U8_9AGAR|nr:armadillo-type protein [Auriculariopsis ampla]
MAEEDSKVFANFGRYDELSALQATLLALDPNAEPTSEEELKEIILHRKLTLILDEYQEQSYLADPFLSDLVSPVVDAIREHARNTEAKSTHRIMRLAALVYAYVKFRGYKTITRFFPHEVPDLAIAMDYMTRDGSPTHDAAQWALRYVVLLWLSLICMIPFDLAQFDEDNQIGRTSSALEALGKQHLGRAGLEREGAAVLLARLYMRRDMLQRFSIFLDWSMHAVQNPDDVFTSLGALNVICEVVKSGPEEPLRKAAPQLLALADAAPLTSNMVLRKYRTKLVARVALRLLPPRSHRKGTQLGAQAQAATDDGLLAEPDIDVPEEVETALEQLFASLQDKDTVVRWSAAKGVARIAERLPRDFAEQILETVLGHFSIHSVASASLYDVPTVAEGTWHGACLTCAEMARRGLVSAEKLPELIGWLDKALYFDLRKGAHSVGSNVRDAAAYVLWALARAHDAALLAPHALALARSLVTVAVYDREISIRRAASAAFQEYVGRTGLFPHGIDVLSKTDFYAVSVRKNAFLVAAPETAVHPEYRVFLFNHVLDVTLRHWDASMRQLGSESLRLLCLLDLDVLGPQAVEKSSKLLQGIDTTDIHGGLLALAEVAGAYRQRLDGPDLEVRLHDIFSRLALVKTTTLTSPRNELVTAEACRLMAATLTLSEVQANDKGAVPHWRKVVEDGLRHRSTTVQEEAASAFAALSGLVDCTDTVKRLIKELRSGSLSARPSVGRMLGVLRYDLHGNALPKAVECLLECVDAKSPAKFHVEARKTCYEAIPRLLNTVVGHMPEHLTPKDVGALIRALLRGLEDYTMDERGDVGSWIRIVSIQGLAAVASMFLGRSELLPSYMPAETFHEAIAGILKQGVERLDNVRDEAGVCARSLLELEPPAGDYAIEGGEMMRTLFLQGELVPWSDGSVLFPKAARLLCVARYRKQVLSGIILSVGSRSESITRPMGEALAGYAATLPVSSTEDEQAYSLPDLLQDVLDHGQANFTSNLVFVPVLQTFNVLVGSEKLQDALSTKGECTVKLSAVRSVATKNISRLKNVQRIQESMKIVVNLLALTFIADPQEYMSCVEALQSFLSHDFPHVRTATAEYMCQVLPGVDLQGREEAVEEILLETEWTLPDKVMLQEATGRAISVLKG